VNAIGRLRWSIAAGWIPSRCSGPEPEFTSRDVLCVLNAGEDLANARIDVLHDTHGKVGPYRMVIAPRRLRRVRINDLIFPEAVRLEEAYGLVLSCDVPVIVQFTRQDTRQPANAGLLATAWDG
jgi:hypothetical protein